MDTQTLLWIILGALVAVWVLIFILIITIRFFLATMLIKVFQKIFKNAIHEIREEFTDTVNEYTKQGKEMAQDKINEVKRKI